MQIDLKTGLLELDYPQELQTLVGFGSRMNKKRGFLFVSRVLGKHLPTKPSIMQTTYDQLAEIADHTLSNEPTLVIGFAETATALGHGVYDALGRENSFYIHSTRYKTSHDVLLNFYEEHCHAPSHIFYSPHDEKLKNMLQEIKNVLLIDDEVSTGTTANNLVTELKKALPHAKNYYLLTLLNWSKKKYDAFEYLSLYKGEFTFTPKDFSLTENIVSENLYTEDLDELIPHNFGRYGVQDFHLDFSSYTDVSQLKNKKVLVLGTSEFMYVPYLFALYLEENGIEVYYQATTRSPVNIEGEITSKLSFKDNYFENIDNFLYNVSDREYDKIFLCYETTSLPKSFDLKERLKNSEEIFFHV